MRHMKVNRMRISVYVFLCVRLEVVKRTPEDWCGTVRAVLTAG